MSLKELLKKNSIVVLDGGRRTPRADILIDNKLPGLFHRYTTNQLGGFAIKATLEASRVSHEHIGHVIMGNALESHRDSIYAARGMALAAGLPYEIPALTVRRICGTGTQAIVNGAHMALLEDLPEGKPLVVVGGGESMQYPHAIFNMRGKKAGNTVVKYGPIDCHALPKGSYAQDMLHMALYDPFAGMAMANTAERLGRMYHVTRQQADAFAYRSQTRAAKARAAGHFAEEIVPVAVQGPDPALEMLDYDTHIRDNISLDGLARLPAVFEPDRGIITPGNASAVVDGAAAMILCRESDAEHLGLRPLFRILGWGVAGVDPKIMGIGPVPSSKAALEMAGLNGHQLDTIELNEAFAPQSLACIEEFKKMGIDPEKVNPQGSAIALGHPLGATGAVLTLTAAYYLKRNRLKYGLVTMCIGGGQGIAMVIENLIR